MTISKHILIGSLLLTWGSLCYSQMVSTFVASGSAVDEALFRTQGGQLYGTGYLNGTLSTFSAGFALEILDSLENPSEMAEISTGEIAIVESQGHRIILYDPINNTYQILSSDIQNPAGIIKMPDSDTLLVSSLWDNNIYKVSPNGDTNLYLSSTLFNAPTSLLWDDSNDLYIANYNSGVIIKNSFDSTLTQFCVLPTSSLGHITKVGSALYATGVFDHKVYKINLLTGSWNVFAGSTQGSMDGSINIAQFNTPNGITSSITGDSLFISEYNTQAIRLISGLLDTSTGIQEPSQYLRMTVWPNPVQDELNVQFNKALISYSIELISSSGIKTTLNSLSHNKNNNTLKIDVPSSCSSGIYSLKVTSESGIAIKKIIIQND